MNPTSQSLLEKDPLPTLIAELALYPMEKWEERQAGKPDNTHGTNEILWEIHKEIKESRWLQDMTNYLFCRTERLRELSGAGSAISEFAYIPIPGLKNGHRIQHPCEIGNRKKTFSILTEAPNNRSRELAWVIPYRTESRESEIVFIFTFDPTLELLVRTINSEWEASTKYWRNAAKQQALLHPELNTTCIHAFTGLHEWMKIIETQDGEDTPISWKRHPVNTSELEHAASAGLDIYYSNQVVAHAWSSLEKRKGRERARLTLQQNICKRVILFDPIYGRIQGVKATQEKASLIRLDPGNTERDRTARSFWESTILQAHKSGSSDIHIEPLQTVGRRDCDLIVSLRKDGQLNFHTKIPAGISEDYVRYALETSGIVREEVFRPQDGRRGWTNPETMESIDLRVSVTPCGAPIHKVVMRLLDTNKLKRGIADIGLEAWEVDLWEKALKLNQSLVLVSGPTNSGKCLSGNTRLRTDKGVFPLKDIVGMHESGTTFKVWNEAGWEPITKVFRCGTKEIVEVHTKSGTILKAASTHPFLTLGTHLQTHWTKTENLQVGDTLLFHGNQPNQPTGDWEKYYPYGIWIGAKNTPERNPFKKNHQEKGIFPDLWSASHYEIAGFLSGWIDTGGHCAHYQIELLTKEEEIARDGRILLATLGVRSSLSKKIIEGRKYWRIVIRGKRNRQRLQAAGVKPMSNYKRITLLSETSALRNDRVSFKIENLRELRNEILAAIQTAYPSLPKGYKGHLQLGPASRKSISVNTLHRIFKTFPKALPLLPRIERLLNNEIEPETIQKIVYTNKEEEMFDIEVGDNHTYSVEGIICHNSTSLYAALLSIFQRDNRRSFATIEDPVEYRLPFRATQSPVQEERGITYEVLIRQAMRNDGDTFMIGEIRDRPTAMASLQLALTGHQVLSSIHANSATETALRLLEFGVDNYILGETLKMVVAQRLVPTACDTCGTPIEPGEVKHLLRKHGGEILLQTAGPKWERTYKSTAKWVEPEGCTACNFTGVNGMRAIQEFLVIDAKNKKALTEGDIKSLEMSMQERSHPKMEETAWKLAWKGIIPMSQAGELTDQLKSY